MKGVIISILHYGSSADTKACLESLEKAQYEGYSVQVVVLDNASKDPLVIDQKKFEKINLALLKSDENLGFTGGHNFVYDYVKDLEFDYFLLLNNDSTVEKSFLNKLVEEMSNQKIGATVPKIYFTKGREFHNDRYNKEETGKVFWYAGGYIDWANVMSVHRGVDEVDRGQYDKVESIDFATGACFLIKKEILEKIGLFDNRYFLYYEDAYLSTKIRKLGYTILYVPQSVVWHNNAGSSGSGSELHDYFLTRNRMLFGMKFAPIRTRVALGRESIRLAIKGRKWQKIGIKDYYLHNFGKGSFAKRG